MIYYLFSICSKCNETLQKYTENLFHSMNETNYDKGSTFVWQNQKCAKQFGMTNQKKKNVIKWQWSSKRRTTQTETQANCLLFKYLWCKLDARVWMAKLSLLPQSFFVKTCHKDFGTHGTRIIQASWFFEGLLFFQLKLFITIWADLTFYNF